MVETAKKQWYVLHTYSGYEDKVKSDLLSRAQSMGMQDYIFRVMVPEESKVETVRGKKQDVEEKIFPGYVLVEMVMTDESWFIVRNTPNVTGFVGSHGGGSKPSPLLDEEVERLLKNQGAPAKRSADVDFELGESVTITEGAFNGMEGKITDIQPDKYKVYVSVDMFGRATTAELDFDQVKKLED
ncbi:transcription termination/antitermination protein NusG [Lactobacillus kalixensis]|nr:transcription termination/antitermination protein NusG [Lactobacillus kalixensis]